MSSNGGMISKFDAALMKSMQQRRSASVEEPVSASVNKWSGANNQAEKRINSEDQKKRRKQEKDEILFNLICWGPH